MYTHTYTHTHIHIHIQVLAFVLIIPAGVTQTAAYPSPVGGPSYSAAGWLLFVTIVAMLVEGVIIALRFLNLALVQQYILPLVITVSGGRVHDHLHTPHLTLHAPPPTPHPTCSTLDHLHTPHLTLRAPPLITCTPHTSPYVLHS